MTAIPLSRVPGIPSLARGLATGEPDVSAFLPDRPDLETIVERARAVRAAFRPRTVAGDTDPRLAAFARGEASAVFTGQQAGLFGGPLLTLVKALSAEALAGQLTARRTTAGPAFWCASEDHDLVEVTRLVLPGPDGPKDAGPDAGALAGNRSPVGTLPVGVDVEALVARATAGLTQPPDGDEVSALVAANRGKTFFEAFSATLAWLLGGTVPVLDAANPSDKPALVPLACRLVRERTEVKRLLAERGAALAAAGHPLQVTSDAAALPLFARVGSDRLLLLETGPRLSLKGLEGSFEAEEVVERFTSGAWLPSFSALTRPLAPSALFPVVATILGPAEIAYWAQGWPLFSWAGIVPPVIVPRPLVALVPAATARVLSKLGLSVEDVLGGEEAMLRKRGSGEARTLLERIGAIRANAIRALDVEEPALLAVDPSLKKAVLATRERTGFAFEKLVEKTAAAAGRADERTAAQVKRLLDELLPGGVLAERAYSALPYVLKFGREAVVGALRRELVWNEPELQVISL
ncbi:MAG: bacillithiol biosynthesis BshC [Thermoanaerobaculia bacterium]